MEAQQLTCPQLMSEETLRNILRERCIEIEEIDKMDKRKLVELFKRVALPLPQRKYNDRKFGRRMQSLRLKRNVKIADYDENNDFSMTVTEPSKMSGIDSNHKDRLKPSIDDTNQIRKKIRLSNSGKNDETENNESKRKNDVPLKADSKKRQKITWP